MTPVTPRAPLPQTEGIFAGFSSGANVAAALQLLAGEMAGRTVAVVICDSGLKYLSTSLWPDRRLSLEQSPRLPHKHRK